MSDNITEVQSVYISSRCLYSKAQVEQALDKMAITITEELSESNPVILCVLTGAIIPMGHLLTRMDFPLEIDYVHATRYQGKTVGKELQWLAKPRIDLTGRNVLIIDDILDEGHTLKGIIDYCQQQGANSVQSAVLVEKYHDRRVKDLSADYVGLGVDDFYVFGYGMDYKDYLRNAPGIYAVTEED
ncbi:MAG: hypoxanthine-guanine phosphoribosyltransferase [Gammaproteobacteria bacterium]|nr:hypoxanthine-guanine phosphoribosyltransferase [Gammaproteobacteria bacterium]